MKRRVLQFGAIFGAAAVSTLAIAPAFAAATVSQASAHGLDLNISSSGYSTGTVAATNDGTGESKTGVTNPPISVLQGQSLITTGVVAQEATAKVTNGGGTSAACAGLAGQGATVAAVGASSCLAGGNAIDIALGNLNLDNLVTIDPNSALGPLGTLLNGPLASLLAPVTSALSSALSGTPLGTTGITATLGAIQAHCTARPGAVTGAANIADIKIDADLGGTKVNLVTLPAPGQPNQGDDVVALQNLVNPLIDALKVDLHTSLNGVADPLNLLTQQVQDNIVNAVVPQLSTALAPLTTKLLSIKRWQQTVTGGDTIDVKALQLAVLPAAATATGFPLISLNIGHVTCGPNGRPAVTPPSEIDSPNNPDLPNVPTVVDSGMAGHADHTARNLLGATAALMLLAGTAGLVGYRRMLIK